MLITVSTASQSLTDIMTEAQQKQAVAMKRNDESFSIIIQNLHATVDVYAETGAAATVAGGAKVQASTGSLELKMKNINDLRLIAASANNNIRIIFN